MEEINGHILMLRPCDGKMECIYCYSDSSWDHPCRERKRQAEQDRDTPTTEAEKLQAKQLLQVIREEMNNKIDTDNYFGELWDNRPGVEFTETEQEIRDERMEDWNED